MQKSDKKYAYNYLTQTTFNVELADFLKFANIEVSEELFYTIFDAAEAWSRDFKNIRLNIN